MSVLNKRKLSVISRKEEADLSKAKLNVKLSAVDFDEEGKYFYMTLDRAVFTDPVSTIQKVLDAHGFVPNLENMLSCLDSFRFSVYTRLQNADDSDTVAAKVDDYLPCLCFELPRKNRIGPVLKSFYDEVSRFDPKSKDNNRNDKQKAAERESIRKLKEKNSALENEKRELQQQVADLTRQLSVEQRSLSRVSKALDTQQVLPANARLGRIESIDLKQRVAKVKCGRRVYEIPTHILDRVPDFQARCLVTFDEDDDEPVGIVFFSNTELVDLEKRTAELLYVDDSTFKARDSKRTEFQIKAVNANEAETIRRLTRGDRVVISIADGYVVRFSVLNSDSAAQFHSRVAEQYLLHDISRNPLVTPAANDAQAG
jgi:hypothetical protein